MLLCAQPALANGILPPWYPNADLINEGRQIFFNETFAGNGRTCGTCHREDDNHTIDPEYIATLPSDDPLFIAERPQPNPLAENFEKPVLMRKVGLILENTNGFDDLAHNFTMRGVPHLLALRTSLSPPSPAANDGTTTPPDDRVGWSGDGAPVDPGVSPQLRGRLRDFAVGAIKQHFTKTLNRVAGVDFRLPSEHEVDALEAYLLSLGRQQEFDDFNTIRLTDPRAEQGRRNYLGEGLANGVPCNACISTAVPTPIRVLTFRRRFRRRPSNRPIVRLHRAWRSWSTSRATSSTARTIPSTTASAVIPACSTCRP